MDAADWGLVVLIVLGVLLTGFAAAAEMALASVSRIRLRQSVAASQSRAQTAEALLSQPARLLSTLMVVKVAGSMMATAGMVILVMRQSGGKWLVWWLLLLGILLLITQLLPRAWVLGREDRFAPAVAPLVSLFVLLLTPVTALLQRAGGAAVPDGAASESIFLSEDGLRFLLNVTDEETVIEDDEKEMIASIFEFGETLAREVMVPRIDVKAVPVDLPMLEALDLILKVGHSRIPVYANSIDNIVGILYAKDMLRYLRDGRTQVPLGKILRPAYFIPESKKVDELLQELQQRKVHMAIVVDEYGGTAGLVTIEDLLEEIVGEIQDEYDSEQPSYEPAGEYSYLFDARVNLDEVNDLLEVELPAEGGDTLGGFIYSQLGKVPAVGDTIEYGDVLIEVLSVAGRRIQQVRASRDLERGALPESGEERDGGNGLLSLF